MKRLTVLAGLVVLGLAPAGVAQAAAQPSEQDTQYLQAIHQVNVFEVDAGDLADEKAKNQQVEELGKRFVKEHKKLDEKVMNTASNAGVTLPDNPTQGQQTVLDRLRNLSGDEFDAQWVAAELAGHQEAIQATQMEIAQGSDPAVKELAQGALPELEEHLNALTALAQAVGVPVPSGTATPPPPGPGTPSPTGPTTPGPTAPTEAPAPGAS